MAHLIEKKKLPLNSCIIHRANQHKDRHGELIKKISKNFMRKDKKHSDELIA